jgi:hypothetical protein
MGLIVSVYRDADGHDCTNGGISARYKRLVLMNVDGPFGPDEDTAPALLELNVGNTVRIVPAKLDAGGDWVLAKPKDHVGPMFGGNYAATSDGRFAQAIRKLTGQYFYGAVAIHDRCDTQELYDALSH